MHADSSIWYLLVGALLLLIVLLQSVIKRLPVSLALLYLLIGVALGPHGVGLLRIDPLEDSRMLEMVTEAAMLVSLFSVGLKMRLPLRHGDWAVPLRLAIGALVLTILLLTLFAKLAFGLPLAAALLLAAIVSPTDPVLASDVQLRDPGDRDRVRFGLTAEGGLNDGIAFPFVILALAWLGAQPMQGAPGWILWELLLPVPIGIAVGWVCGYAMGKLALHGRRQDQSNIGLDEFLALGVMGVAYGAALLLHGNGFLAVFAAGLALRRVEVREVEETEQQSVPLSEIESSAAPEAPARLMRSMLTFNEQLEHIFEVGVVLIIGAMLSPADLTWTALAAAAVLFVVVRPLSVLLTFAARPLPGSQLRLIAWFGIRGVGSLYYLMYSVNHGLAHDLAQQLIVIVLPVVAASIVVHGISATPLMTRYSRMRRRSTESAGR
jgi:NhaP-type Na+/H+ or K+/H+ antiporter